MYSETEPGCRAQHAAQKQNKLGRQVFTVREAARPDIGLVLWAGGGVNCFVPWVRLGEEHMHEHAQGPDVEAAVVQLPKLGRPPARKRLRGKVRTGAFDGLHHPIVLILDHLGKTKYGSRFKKLAPALAHAQRVYVLTIEALYSQSYPAQRPGWLRPHTSSCAPPHIYLTKTLLRELKVGAHYKVGRTNASEAYLLAARAFQ